MRSSSITVSNHTPEFPQEYKIYTQFKSRNKITWEYSRNAFEDRKSTVMGFLDSVTSHFKNRIGQSVGGAVVVGLLTIQKLPLELIQPVGFGVGAEEGGAGCYGSFGHDGGDKV
jgi:hypothetical protein